LRILHFHLALAIWAGADPTFMGVLRSGAMVTKSRGGATRPLTDPKNGGRCTRHPPTGRSQHVGLNTSISKSYSKVPRGDAVSPLKRPQADPFGAGRYLGSFPRVTTERRVGSITQLGVLGESAQKLPFSGGSDAVNRLFLRTLARTLAATICSGSPKAAACCSGKCVHLDPFS